MAEIQDLSPTDASNTGRWPENMAPSAVNNAGRADEGMLARWYADTNGSIASAGTDTVTLAASRTISAYAQGQVFVFEAGGTNTGAVTLNVDSVGAKAVKKRFNVALAAGDIVAGQIVAVAYEATADNFQLLTPVATASGDVVGPASATDNSLAKFDGTTGKLLKNGAVIGTDVQAFDANLSNLAALTPVAGRLIGYDTSGAEAVVRQAISNNGYATNRYYGSEGLNAPLAGLALVADTLYAIPFRVKERTTFTRIGIEITAFAGTNAKLGIYNAASGIPTTLVVDGGNVSTGSNALVEATISQTLMPGLYFLAVVADNTPTVWAALAQNPIMQSDVGYLTADAQASGGTFGIRGSHAFAALPANFPAVSYSDVNNFPWLWLRVV